MKKILFIVLPILLVGGGVVGAAFMGVINIPGLTPKKKMGAMAYGEKKDEKPAVEAADETKPTAKKEKPKPKPEQVSTNPTDPDAGVKKIAKLWNAMETENLAKLVKDWTDDDLAKVMLFMPNEKVAELLGTLEPARASKISRALKSLAQKAEEKAAKPTATTVSNPKT